MLPFKLYTRRNLALKLRDVYGISSADMVVIKSLSDCLLKATMLKKALDKRGRLIDKVVNTYEEIADIDHSTYAMSATIRSLHSASRESSQTR